jgi:apolipoprotein N-acyltransferase
LEFLKENIWCGVGWANLGYSQYKNLYFIQVADLLGVKLVSFFIIMVNVLIYESIFIRKLILRKTVSVSLIIILCFFYSFYRLRNLKETDSVGISLVQPNISQEVKQDIHSKPYIIKKLNFLTKEIESSSLIIYPEAAWPQINNNDELDELREFTRNLNKEMLMGAVIRESSKFYNTALLLDKDGKCIDIYRKIKLVPFGEYVPLRELLVAVEALNSIENMERGKVYKVFSYKEKKFSVLICFEDIFPLFVSRFSKKSDFLINITDDSWFKGEPQASQHLAIMTLRAIENRVSMARCANTGISAWVSFKGQINKLKKNDREVFAEDTLSFKLPLNTKKSLYNKVGEVLPIFCSLILLTVFFRR